MCLVAFQKIFRKIFSDVWKRRRKRQTQEKYHQRLRSEIAISRSTAQARDGAISRSTRHEIAPFIAISVEGEIAINCAISRRRDLAKARSRSTLREIAPSIAIFTAIVELELARSAPPGARSPPAIVRLTGMFLILSRARALSRSLSFSGNALK